MYLKFRTLEVRITVHKEGERMKGNGQMLKWILISFSMLVSVYGVLNLWNFLRSFSLSIG